MINLDKQNKVQKIKKVLVIALIFTGIIIACVLCFVPWCLTTASIKSNKSTSYTLCSAKSANYINSTLSFTSDYTSTNSVPRKSPKKLIKLINNINYSKIISYKSSSIVVLIFTVLIFLLIVEIAICVSSKYSNRENKKVNHKKK